MKKALCTLSLLLTLPLTLLAGPVEVGQPLPALSLKDQHDQAWQLTPETKLVLFAAGRKASNLVLAVLSTQPKGFLEQRKAAYLADMSRMPGFITHTFAMPSLRAQPFKVGVSLSEDTLRGWASEPEAVLLIDLEQGRVSRIRHASSEAELRQALLPQP
ncbi:hypothetical protein [Malikia spinosa]|uniref:hypothetical protein n=1 Tax=Malikia spinosa TaxID=86180 RepID=UPI0026D0C702